MMKITQFKKMLSLHGADFSRWEGINPKEAAAFLDSSDAAKALYDEAVALDMALDRFDTGQADPALLNKVMQKVGAPDDIAGATIHPFVSPSRSRERHMPSSLPVWQRPAAFWGGVTALAAAVILFVAIRPNGFVSPSSHQVPPAVVVAQNDTAAVDTLYAELDKMEEETVLHQEMIGLLAQAHIEQESRNIERVFEQMYNEVETQAVPQDEVDLWLLYLASET